MTGAAAKLLEFQSTPPSREATILQHTYQLLHITFQSTPPSREATTKQLDNAPFSIISIHASLAGGDAKGYTQQQIADISIHASLAGGDIDAIGARRKRKYFNPRLPRGRRLTVRAGNAPDYAFQSTPPSREATFGRCGRPRRPINFNPRLPRGRRPDAS